MITSVEELQGRKVALYGLSANPPTGHSGHLGVVEYLVETGLFDEVWILPVYQHMFSTKRAMESFHHRVAMCNLCMPGASRPDCKVHVKEIEKYAAEHYEEKEGSAFRVGTVDILDYILSSWPGLRLNLVLGTDTYQDLMARKWKQSDRYGVSTALFVTASIPLIPYPPALTQNTEHGNRARYRQSWNRNDRRGSLSGPLQDKSTLHHGKRDREGECGAAGKGGASQCSLAG